MRNILAVVAGLVAVAATLPYIWDTIRHKTKPNIVTWLTWGLLATITTVAAVDGHAVQTAIFAGATALCDFAIVIAGLQDGIKKYTVFDIVCQVLAVVGIGLWQITNQPGLAMLFVIVSDLIGALPTYRHGWLKPYEETLKTYVMASVAAGLSTLSLASFAFVASGYPVYILLSCVSFVGVIAYRRQLLSQKA